MLDAFAFWYTDFFAESRAGDMRADRAGNDSFVPARLGDLAWHAQTDPAKTEWIFLVEKRSFDRYGCAVNIENRVFGAVQYSASD